MNALRFFASVTMALMLCVERPVAGSDSFFDGVLELANLDGTNGFLLHGIDANDSSGDSVSGAGDVNGDGIDNLLRRGGVPRPLRRPGVVRQPIHNWHP